MGRTVVLFALFFAAGCAGAPPDQLDVTGLAHLEAAGVRVYYTGAVERSRLERDDVAGAVAQIWSGVEGELGVAPPRAEVILHRPREQSLRREPARVLETRAHLGHSDGAWRIRFRYPWTLGGGSRGALLSTACHEIAEAAVMLRVTVLDPYVRWMHDGVADLVEHLVLSRVQPLVAEDRLRLTLDFVASRRAEGVDRIDLRRWRQLSPVVVRSHRFVDRAGGNLSLTDVPGSLERVRSARAATDDPGRQAALDDLVEILAGARDVADRPWAEGEARPHHPVDRDSLFYAASFAYFLALERAHPGTAKGVVRLLSARREAGDHVLTAAEVEALVAEAADPAGGRLPDLSRITTEDVLGWLRAEQHRMERR